eukprot:gene5207-5738_t
MQVPPDAIVDLQEIAIVGNKRTKTSFFAHELSDCGLKGRGGTMSEMDSTVSSVATRLNAANLFDEVNAELNLHSMEEGRIKARLVISVKEKGIPYLNAQSYVTGGDKSDVGCEIQGALRSPFGYGEHIRLSAGTSATGNRDYVAQVSLPQAAGGRWELTAKSSQEEIPHWLTYQHAPKTLMAEFHPQLHRSHQLFLEYSLRDEVPHPAMPPSATVFDNIQSIMQSKYHPASAAVLASASSSVKTSVKHVWTPLDDSVDVLPGRPRRFLRTSTEFAAALLGARRGAAEFIKTEITGRYEFAVGPRYLGQPGLTLSFGATLGLLCPLHLFALQPNVRPQGTYLTDRFSLGGPLSLRGFAVGGAGPRSVDQQDSLGGDGKTAFVVVASVPVAFPSLAQASMRAFAFLNAGSLGRWSETAGLSEETPINNALAVFGKMRVSTGFGLSLMMSNAVRAELTWSLPLVK